MARALRGLVLAALLGAAAFLVPSRVARRASEQSISRVEICIHRDCKRRGGGEKLRKAFEAMAEGTGIEARRKTWLFAFFSLVDHDI